MDVRTTQPAGPTAIGEGRLNLLLSATPWDPDPWADRLPVLLEPIGVRSLRVSTGRQATEVIRLHEIHIAVVDLALPLDEGPGPLREGGVRLLELLRRLEAPPPTVVIKRAGGRREEEWEVAAALRAGAFAVLDRPREPAHIELLLEVLRRCLERYYQGRWPAPARGETAQEPMNHCSGESSGTRDA